MSDMTAAITPKSDQISADSLIGGDMTITITGVDIRPGQEQPVDIQFEGSPLVYRPCKSMARVLVAIWGPDAKAYVGRSLQIYRDPTVKWGGMEVGGIRIRAMTNMEGNRPVTMALTATKGQRKPYVVQPLKMAAGVDADAVLAEAKAAAAKGTEAFTAWWNGETMTAAKRDAVKPQIAEIKAICTEADARLAPVEEELDEFGLPPLKPQPTEGGEA